jgi:hypothetical protein
MDIGQITFFILIRDVFFLTGDYMYIHIKANEEKVFFSPSSSVFSVLVWCTNVDIFVGMYIDRRVFARLYILDCSLGPDLVVLLSTTFVHQHDKLQDSILFSSLSFSLTIIS